MSAGKQLKTTGITKWNVLLGLMPANYTTDEKITYMTYTYTSHV